MPLEKLDKVPRHERVMMLDTKNIDLDRTLINLFMLLKHRGWYPVSRTGIVDRTAKGLADWLTQDTNFPGFAEHPDVTQAWLESDFLDLVNRGGKKEALAAPRPIHLNAYKLRNARHCKDYGSAPQLFRLLSDEEDRLPERLRDLLLQGCDPHTDRLQGGLVDMETLTILRLADREGRDQRGPLEALRHKPLCTGQGRLLRNDVRRLLRYADVIPRPVWVDYFKTLCGLHLALFVRRLAAQIGRWMNDRSLTPECATCPVDPMRTKPLDGCPFPLEFIVDMGDRTGTRMAEFSQASAGAHFRAMDDFIRDLIGLTKLIQYIETTSDRFETPLLLVEQALRVYRENAGEFRGYCRSKIAGIIGMPPEERFIQIRDQFADDPFRAYVESTLLVTFRDHHGHFRDLFRSLLSSNREHGMLVTGRSARSPARFHLGTRLLETLVQIAVLEHEGEDALGSPVFRSRPILIRDLMDWLRHRYGIVIGARQLANSDQLSPADFRALRDNEEHFKDRLREIGFYVDLSDAYNAQRVTPRYEVG